MNANMDFIFCRSHDWITMTLPSFGSFFNANVDSVERNSSARNLKFGFQDVHSSSKFTSQFTGKETIQGKYE